MKPENERKSGFEQLVKQNMRRAYFVALGFTGAHDPAMELSQEAFIRAYRNFNNFDKDKNFFTWYYKILKNLCLNFLRDNKNRKTELYLEPGDALLTGKSPEEIFEENELVQELYLAMDKLNAEEREILVLREFEEMSYHEISALLNIPEGTVMSRLYYARKKLAALIPKDLR
jgi:RNA polymerase sigma-70 factor (ECF subfamily)